MTAFTSVLIVEDEPAVRELMARWVTSLGLHPSTAANADAALKTLQGHHYDMAVIDVLMPGRDGLWLAAELKRDYPDTAVVLATGHNERLNSAGLPTPVADFLIKPFRRERFVLAVDRGRDWRRQALFEVEWQARLAREVDDRVIEVCNRVSRARFRGIDGVTALFEIAAARIPDAIAHGERVARHAASLARELSVAEVAIPTLEQAARFHDIGKIAMPEPLLTKPSLLTPGELAVMQRHVDAGADILDATVSLRETAPVVRASHEWFSGGGYPQRLVGASIPFASRLLAVADAYDSMTQDRAYWPHFDSSEALAELLRCSPVQFDPDIVRAFLTMRARH